MTTSEQQKFVIGDRAFYMKRITLGQLEHLLKVVTGLTMPDDAMGIVMAMGERLPKAMACVLVPDGQTPGQLVQKLDDGGLEELAAFMRGEVSFEQAVEVASCFLDANPISSVSAKLVSLAKKIGAVNTTVLPKLDGKPFTRSCPEETSLKEPASASA